MMIESQNYAHNQITIVHAVHMGCGNKRRILRWRIIPARHWELRREQDDIVA